MVALVNVCFIQHDVPEQDALAKWIQRRILELEHCLIWRPCSGNSVPVDWPLYVGKKAVSCLTLANIVILYD